MFEPLIPSPSAIGTGWLSFNRAGQRIDFARAKPLSSILQVALAKLLQFENYVHTPDTRTDNS